MALIDEVLTAKEASLIWGIKDITLRQACLGQKGAPPRFFEGEFRKSEGTWLVTRAGMTRLYGEPPTK